MIYRLTNLWIFFSWMCFCLFVCFQSICFNCPLHFIYPVQVCALGKYNLNQMCFVIPPASAHHWWLRVHRENRRKGKWLTLGHFSSHLSLHRQLFTRPPRCNLTFQLSDTLWEQISKWLETSNHRNNVIRHFGWAKSCIIVKDQLWEMNSLLHLAPNSKGVWLHHSDHCRMLRWDTDTASQFYIKQVWFHE